MLEKSPLEVNIIQWSIHQPIVALVTWVKSEMVDRAHVTCVYEA